MRPPSASPRTTFDPRPERMPGRTPNAQRPGGVLRNVSQGSSSRTSRLTCSKRGMSTSENRAPCLSLNAFTISESPFFSSSVQGFAPNSLMAARACVLPCERDVPPRSFLSTLKASRRIRSPRNARARRSRGPVRGSCDSIDFCVMHGQFSAPPSRSPASRLLPCAEPAPSGELDYAPLQGDFGRIRPGLPVLGAGKPRRQAISSARTTPTPRKWPMLHFGLEVGDN